MRNAKADQYGEIADIGTLDTRTLVSQGVKRKGRGREAALPATLSGESGLRAPVLGARDLARLRQDHIEPAGRQSSPRRMRCNYPRERKVEGLAEPPEDERGSLSFLR